MLSVDEQMRIITSGAARIVPEADLRKKLEKGEPLNIKLGVDPTSPDLHLGHAVPLRKMRQFQDLGHNVTLIIGNGTALIGDPSGKNSTRPQLSQEQIEANAETYVSQAMKILDPEKTTIVHNGDWILSMDLAGLLQVCSKFTVARILERDDFTKRYQSQTPIALHEFLYPVMQAFDSVQIKADVEMGGTDQLFNLLAGRELMEKMGMEPQIALTMPLLEGTDGVRKMSKSYGNYIGLTDAPKDMFGKTMSIPDEMIGKYYRLASSLTPAEVDKIDAALADGSADPYELKRALGRDLCDTYHGAGAGDEAQAEFDRVFKEGQLADFPEKHVELTVNDEGQIYLAGLLKDLGLSASAGQARRDIDGGGVKINGKAVAPRATTSIRAPSNWATPSPWASARALSWSNERVDLTSAIRPQPGIPTAAFLVTTIPWGRRDHLAVPLSGRGVSGTFFWAYNGYWLAAVKARPPRSYFYG